MTRTPMTVEIHVPTPEALHELSIFLQTYMHKHHGHADSFAAETGAHHQHAAHHQAPVMPGTGAAPVQQAISHQEVIALQKRLVEGGTLTLPALMKIYQDAGIDPTQIPAPDKCTILHGHLMAVPGAR